MIHLPSNENCCGCGACAQACHLHSITMKRDYEGFLYPDVDIYKCIHCGMCEDACPALHPVKENLPKKAYAAKNPDESVRIKSSSGGLFRLIAEQVIKEGGIVYGAKFNENWEVVHDYTETIEGLSAFQGSKYVQSRIGDCFKEAFDFAMSNRLVLFTGTPCQIAGLKQYVRYPINKLITLDIICHGAPSPVIWEKYIQTLPQFDHISFRDKSNGWKNYEFVVKQDNIDVLREHRSNNLYMNLFLSDLCLRPICYDCPAKAGKSRSDITIADFWGIDQLFPEFDDDKGCSMVLINTPKGEELFNKISCEKIETTLEDATKHNLSYYKSAEQPEQRETFFYDFKKYGFDIYKMFFGPKPQPLHKRIINRIKRLFSR